MMERCTDCGYFLRMHFRSRHVPRAGEYIGCPRRSTGMSEQERLPRITVRVSSRGEHKGHTLVAWADYRDADEGAQGVILLWDLQTGDQWMGDQRKHHRDSKRAPRDVALNAKESVEYEVGGPVRLLFTAHARGG